MADAAAASTRTGAMQMSAEARSGFRSELEKLRANAGPGPRDRTIGVFGVALTVIGLITILVAFNQATSMSDIRDQLEMLILASFGIAVAIAGAVVYAVMSAQRFMRFWLLRVIYEQRDLSCQHDPVAPTEHGVRVETSSQTTHTPQGAF